jgi:hypothetical protein
MLNKTQLQTNNNTLEALITRVNAAKDTAASLPEAGGGSEIQTCTITITKDAGDYFNPAAPAIETPTFYYVDASTLTIQSISTLDAIIVVPVNSIIVVTEWTSMYNKSGLCTEIFYHMGRAAFAINGDCTLKYIGG